MRHKKLLTALIALVIVIVGCGEKEKDMALDYLKKEAHLYLLEEDEGAPNKGKKDRTTTIQSLRTEAEYEKNEQTKEKFLLLARLMEKKELEEVRKLYLDLGGDPTSIPQKSHSQISGTQVPVATSTPVSVANKGGPVSKEARNIVASIDPEKVQAEIKSRAEKKWKADNKMILYEINEQTGAYNALLKIETNSQEKELILKNATSKWEWDFGMIKYEYEEQMKALESLQKIDVSNANNKKILDDAYKKWKDDYGMVLYEYNEQMKSYNELQKKK